MEEAVLKAIATVQHVVCTFSQGSRVEERFEAFEQVPVTATDVARESMGAWAEAPGLSRSVHAAVDAARAALHKETADEIAAVTTEGVRTNASLTSVRALCDRHTGADAGALTCNGVAAGFPPASSAMQVVATGSGDVAVRSRFSNSNEADEGAGGGGWGSSTHSLNDRLCHHWHSSHRGHRIPRRCSCRGSHAKPWRPA